ncbi:hypothetical protein SB658_24600, partial [Bacillus sp. SIMBA_008]|uniref:hypothetical protein n=1 Tax=Bacillus sp. SIMBA_008 TaxID=3085757 RepID=UPI0039791D9E
SLDKVMNPGNFYFGGDLSTPGQAIPHEMAKIPMSRTEDRQHEPSNYTRPPPAGPSKPRAARPLACSKIGAHDRLPALSWIERDQIPNP